MHHSRYRRLVATAVATAIAALLLLTACGSPEEEGSVSLASSQDDVYAALDRYQQAKSTGSRRDILATLTPDSPQRQFYAGSDEDFDITREALNIAKYRLEFIKRRDLTIDDTEATFYADSAETRSDTSEDGTPSTTIRPGILIEVKRRVDGTWLVHDVVSQRRQADRELGITVPGQPN
ncbi:hypothetical protein QSJ19_03075 [Gordonia sp. ABSL11-1]|uniref:hypothetical protein n=1 Tax=Gordonia sp. ABSL11-1 TaxID=3053924 RepID=UPI002572971A|nr:hypothetical protein [Gordonia sp. ABSL11-1]MDL9944582.1 hypothetical protein [Gordonia sp. ABSL11-1]